MTKIIEYDIIDVRCIMCKELVTPDEVDWPLFRLGYHVHSEEANPECIPALAEKSQEWQDARMQ